MAGFAAEAPWSMYRRIPDTSTFADAPELRFPVAIDGSGVVRTAQIQRCHPGAKRIEKKAVVRHDDDGAGIQSKRLFQRLLRFDFEVIGRLVQKQQIRSAGKDADQRYLGSLPSTQLLEWPVETIRA